MLEIEILYQWKRLNVTPCCSLDGSLFPVKDLFCETLQKHDSLSNSAEFWNGHMSTLRWCAMSKLKG